MTLRESEAILQEHKKHKKERIRTLAMIFGAACLLLLGIWWGCPPLHPKEREQLFKMPKSPSDLAKQLEIIQAHQQRHPIRVGLVWAGLYVFLQSFAIPGPIFLSIIAGPLFGPMLGMLLISLCATTGASICYLLSRSIVKGFVIEYKPGLVRKFTDLVESNRQRIFYFMLFLRITPLVPNWFVNLGSPIAGIPLSTFWLGTFFGLMPFNYIHVNTGMALNTISKFGASAGQLGLLAGLSLLTLLPTLLTRGKKLDNKEE